MGGLKFRRAGADARADGRWTVQVVGLSWEIDEPGFVFRDIYDNFLLGTLDNAIGSPLPDDVSMALGWQFLLNPVEQGLLEFLLGTTPPVGFHLRQFDPDGGECGHFRND